MRIPLFKVWLLTEFENRFKLNYWFIHYNEMNLAHLKKQIHYNRVMYIAVLHLRHLPHRLIIFIYDHKDIFYVPQKVITHEYINHDHCVYS
ncbi:hypothetical protein BEE46_25080, partial [Salmonella enterica subsp. enterica serovar Schwarzengrund]|nr:hypothetical protein [Salmonella enterica subsp. enterica serovar Schwarzengrund]